MQSQNTNAQGVLKLEINKYIHIPSTFGIARDCKSAKHDRKENAGKSGGDIFGKLCFISLEGSMHFYSMSDSRLHFKKDLTKAKCKRN